jgi:hypothetical protein
LFTYFTNFFLESEHVAQHAVSAYQSCVACRGESYDAEVRSE